MECEIKHVWKCFFVKFSIWAVWYMVITVVLVYSSQHISIFMIVIAGAAIISILVLAQSIECSRIIQNVVKEAKKEAEA